MVIGAVSGSAQAHGCIAQGHGGAPGGPAGNGRQVQGEVLGDRQAVEMSVQIAVIGQPAVGLSPGQQFDLRRTRGESGIDIALAVGNRLTNLKTALDQPRKPVGQPVNDPRAPFKGIPPPLQDDPAVDPNFDRDDVGACRFAYIESVDHLPDQWFGYDAVDVVVLTTGKKLAEIVTRSTVRGGWRISSGRPSRKPKPPQRQRRRGRLAPPET